MSRNIPPDTATYSAGGGAGSRLVIRRISGTPIPPPAITSRIRAKSGSNRRLNPTWSLTAALRTAPRISSRRLRSRSTGFSQKICLPARAAAMTCSGWASVLEQISTASTAGSSNTAPASPPASGILSSRANSLATSSRGSAMRMIRALRMRVAMVRAWTMPMRPAPMRPSFMCTSDLCHPECSRGTSGSMYSKPEILTSSSRAQPRDLRLHVLNA